MMKKEVVRIPGKHKEPIIAFRPSAWERAIIEQRAATAYLFDKKVTSEDSGWKDSLEVEQYRQVLNLDITGN